MQKSKLTYDQSSLSDDVLNAIDQDTSTATGLPNHAYTSESFFQREQEKLFARTWTCIGNACSIPDPGDINPVGFLGTPLMMLRDKNNAVRVFHNVCSHRGNELVWEACQVENRIRCPYHSWSYSLDGELLGTPHVGSTGVHDIDSLDKSRHGLREVRCAV